jgi:hypothetical protein
MAELNTSCCSTETQAICCEPAEKEACCGPEGCEPCGCAPTTEATPEEIREAVGAKYAEYAVAAPDIEIIPTHRVHSHASAAIIRAAKPAA